MSDEGEVEVDFEGGCGAVGDLVVLKGSSDDEAIEARDNSGVDGNGGLMLEIKGRDGSVLLACSKALTKACTPVNRW